ncbi:MAG TPA: hypothetical protein VF746_04730 [Longimicrobium sp.]|jgi:hypothetical protein
MTPKPVELRSPAPDPHFRLTPAERSKVLPDFDADALERLLSMVIPEMRQEILRHFQPRAPGERLGNLVQFYDPKLQAVLEEVWAPFWDTASDEEIEKDWYGMPGRLIAKQRREADRRLRGEQQ